MSKIVVAMFDSPTDAEEVARILAREGFAPRDIEIRSTGASGSPGREPGWWDWLFGESDQRTSYTENLGRGGAILAVTTPVEGVERAQRIIEAEGGEVQSAGGSGATSRERPRRERAVGGGERTGEDVLPVVEERLRVGKRPVARGGVRVYSRVREEPVEEQVRLREERVHVQRRPADRPVSEADAAAIEEDVIELTETAEEVVVAKEARVVEEVVIDTEIDERVETVRDSVRRSEVEVERLGSEPGARRPMDADDTDYRQHWSTTGRDRGLSYEESTPAYRFGAELATDSRSSARDWPAIEPEARRRWEASRPGTWERFTDAIRYAWDRARGRARAA